MEKKYVPEYPLYLKPMDLNKSTKHLVLYVPQLGFHSGDDHVFLNGIYISRDMTEILLKIKVKSQSIHQLIFLDNN